MPKIIKKQQIFSLLNILISECIKLEDELGNDYDLSNILRYFSKVLKEYLD